MLVDSHCHLSMPQFTSNLDNVIFNAIKNDVQYMQTICTKLEELEDILKITDKYNNIFASVGVHPNNTTKDISTEKLIQLSKHNKIIGVGETGLDYYYKETEAYIQKKSFVSHINASAATSLPIIIHSRNADKDMIEILVSEMKNQNFQGLLHCFSSTKELAYKTLDLGLYISISGIITFNSAEDLRNIVSDIPLERLLIETDAPYLAPTPHRERFNEPAYVRVIAEKIAKIKNISFDKFAEISSSNFFRLFKKAQKI